MTKKTVLIVTALFISIFLYSQQINSQKENPAAKISRFWLVMLTRGNNRTQDSVTAARIQTGHLANITKLYMVGKIKVAGPVGSEGDPGTNTWLGLFIFDCETKAEVETLLKTDPAVSAGRLAYEIRAWYTLPDGSFSHGKPEKPLN